MRITVTHKIGAAFASALIILVVGVLSLYMVNRFLLATAQVDHTVSVMSEVRDALSELKDAETGQRGYVITGDSNYLAPYVSAHETVAGHLRSLHALTIGNAPQQRRLDKLDTLVAAKFAELEGIIKLRRDSGFAAAQAMVKTDRGKRMMDEARALIAGVEAAERRELEERSARRATVARRVLGMIALGSLGAFLLALLINRAIRADVLEQMRLRDRLAEEVEESRVLAEELEQTNQELEETAEAAEDARAAAAAANTAKSDFLATMSHELRTPINAILGYAELLEQEIFGPVSPQQRPQLARITGSAKHLLGLINEVLDLAKVESGTLNVEREHGLPGDTADAALAFIRPQAIAKGITVSEQCDGTRDSAYVGDVQRVRQVLTNLLGNAVKFTDRGGRIALSCTITDRPAPESGLAQGVSWVAFHVEDTGIGISADQLSHIFEPFAQAQSGYTRERSGTGLGLSISRRLARLMGGDITVESTVKVGSRFTLWLPAADGAIAPSPLAARSAAAASTVHPRDGV